jgi:ATP-dependent 26S proteasome regulatory subunit
MLETTAAAYSNSWEHLSDELRRLDVLIRLSVMRHRSRQKGEPFNELKGLVVSEGEIEGLLSHHEGPFSDCCYQGTDHEMRPMEEALHELEVRIRGRVAESLAEGVSLLLPRLCGIFDLTPFEAQCLLVCLAPEIDVTYDRLYAYLQDDITRKRPGVDLLLQLLCQTPHERIPARLSFEAQSPLRKYQLIHFTDGTDTPAPLISRLMKMDDRIVDFLLGFRQIDGRLESFARLVPPEAVADDATMPRDIAGRIERFVRSCFAGTKQGRKKVVCYLYGPPGAGKCATAHRICHAVGISMLAADMELMLNGPLAFDDAVCILGRESILQQSALCIEHFDSLLTEDEKERSRLRSLVKAIQTFSPLTFLIAGRQWRPDGVLKEDIFIDIEFPIPDDGVRKQLWESHLKESGSSYQEIDSGALASKFRFTPGQIKTAIAQAQHLALWHSRDDGCMSIEDLYAACRAQSNPKLSSLAYKIEAKYGWEDIVLPPYQLAQLREISNQAKYRHIVYGEWGFDRKLSHGKGLNALFSGPSGTGKTMAAEVIATELNLDLYKIDLSQVVSKYIGETEKNLDRIFTEARTSSAILFFDEADALFGKRSEVKDAHDRYANVEIGYLLQKMDEYDGTAILATNFRQNIDEAFIRRISFIVEFPFPEEEYRLRIWRGIWPKETPLSEDVDFHSLARQFRLAGGSIRNIALAAAFMAAENAQVVGKKYLLQSTRRELQKMGSLVNDGEFPTEVLL